jgi:uncharacterized protein YjlB
MRREMEPLTLRFDDDGAIPNHPRFPALLYRGVEDAAGGPGRLRGDVRAQRLGAALARRRPPVRPELGPAPRRPAEHDEVVANIARVPDPETDPVGGSLTELWT